MPLASLYSLVVLAVLLGAQIMRPFCVRRQATSDKYDRIFKYGFLISTFFVLFVPGYLTFQQYRVWKASALSQLLLPPHQPIGYFIQYSIAHFWTAPLIAFAMALIALVAAKLLNKKFQERFFWPAEPWLFATGILLTGHPGWMYYTTALFAALLVSGFRFQVSRNTERRLSFYWLWLPVAIGVILIEIANRV